MKTLVRLMFLAGLAVALRSLVLAEEVTLAWDPSRDADLQGYVLRYGFQSSNYVFARNVGKVTTNTVPGLLPGSNYFFVVRAYNGTGLESDDSNEVIYQVAQTPPVKPPVVLVRPDPPNSLRIVRLASAPALEDTVNIAWNASSLAPSNTTYFLYASTNVLSSAALSNAPIRLNVGTNVSASLRAVAAGRWSFAVTASRGGPESYPANILVVEVSPAPIESGTVIDAGAFRVRLP